MYMKNLCPGDYPRANVVDPSWAIFSSIARNWTFRNFQDFPRNKRTKKEKNLKGRPSSDLFRRSSVFKARWLHL